MSIRIPVFQYDFEYRGQVLGEDGIQDYTITSDHDKLGLKVIEKQNPRNNITIFEITDHHSEEVRSISYRGTASIDLTVGMFFDSTLNNRYNIDLFKKSLAKHQPADSSYQSDYSNVSRLFDL